MTSSHLAIGVSLLTLVAACAANGQSDTIVDHERETTDIAMGDGHITGDQVAPFDFEWTQCSLQDGAWVAGPPLREALTLREDGNFALSQYSSTPEGQVAVITHILDRETLQRTELTQAVTSAGGHSEPALHLRFSADGFAVLKDGQEHPGGAISSEMYGGAYLGLPLSTLDYSGGGFAFDAGMLAVQGTYRVEATPVGIEQMIIEGDVVNAQRVDVWWLHHESGDVYAPGPDGSGGRYWLNATSSSDLPRVLAYKTDTYAIEYAPNICPPLE